MKGLFCIIFFVFFLNTLDFGSAVKCYSCVSTIIPKCKDDVKDASVGAYDCVAGEPVCMTLDIKGIITRGCGAEEVCKLYDKVDGASCKSCTGDLCNSQNGGYMPSYATSLGLFVALYTSLKLLL